MRITSLLAAGLLMIWSTTTAGEFAADRLHNWHQWRGPNANGVATAGDPPVQWSESTNVQWKVKLPGAGSSTPIVWGDRIILLAAINTNQKPTTVSKVPASNLPEASQDRPEQGGDRQRRRGRGGFRHSTAGPTSLYQFVVLCLDRKTGRQLWQVVAKEEVPHEGHHPSHGFASASPTTDGKRIFASFGSRGIFCYDMEGTRQWTRDLGDMRIKVGFGEGSSPVLHGNSLIVNWDHEGDSFIVCLDAETGEEKWRMPRDEGTTWATPLIVEHAGAHQVITNAQTRTRSYDLSTGELIWECGGQAGNPIPMPVTQNGLAYCMTGFRGYAVYALPLDAKGDITEDDKTGWRRTDTGPYVASPVLVDDLLYFTKERRGILWCVDAKTGDVRYRDRRLPGIGTLYASLTAAAGRIYIAGRDGTTVVVKHGPEYDVLATNQLDEGIDASPVIVGKQLLLRGNEHLYCISEE